nr:carboxypeptidase regulatory-like domain-containing protein [Nitrosomonas nitrosa]
MKFFQRTLCVVLAANLTLFGVSFPSAVAQEDPGPGDQTTPAPTDPEKPPAPPEGEKPPTPAPGEGAAPPAPESEQTGIQGQLLDLDGTTPIANEEVRVTDNQGKEVAKATSGVDGKFTLPVLADGSYVLETRGVRQPFEVKPEQPIKELKILVPAASFAPAGAAPVKDDDDSGTVLIFVGVGAAVIVAGLAAGLAIALADSDDEDDTFIGPQSNEPPTVSAPPNASAPTPPQPLIGFALGVTGEFGTVHLGEAAVREVKIRNSTPAVQLFTASVTGAGFSLQLPNGTKASTQTITAPPNSEVVFYVVFNALSAGTATGSMTITASPGSGGTTERTLAESDTLMLNLRCTVNQNPSATPTAP